jgi:Pectinacetylesterase
VRSGKATALAIVTAAVIGLTAGSGSATSPPISDPAADATLPATETVAEATLPATETVAEATLPATETVASDSAWEKVVPGGDCACADGSEFNFWVREADPAKVVLFLEGGGACFDPTTCAFTDEETTTYDWNISPDDEPSLMDGIFNFERADNPFADYSFVYVPYCTGDVHPGNLTREYSPDLTVEHVGMVNGDAALSYLAENFVDAEQVVVVGESAGSIASPVYAGLVSDLLPDAQITVYADGSGAYPDDPAQNAGIGGLWGTFESMPDWEVNEGLTPEDWGIPRFWVQAGLHDPEIVMSRFDFAYDEVQAAFMGITGSDRSDLAASIAANEAMIEERGVVQHSFTAPGTDHTLVRTDEFYDMEVGGVVLSDWVADVVAGQDVADVTCEECGAPVPPTTG